MLTLNEESRIESALQQFRPYVDYILVVDGGSEDGTVELAQKIADKVVVHEPLNSDSTSKIDFAEEKNYARKLVPKDCTWLLWADADEKWDKGFLEKLKWHIEALKGEPGVMRFARINLADGKDYPDFQIRVFPNSRSIFWRGQIHEIPWLKTEEEEIPLDQVDKPREGEEKRAVGMSIFTFKEYPILHFERRSDIERGWWNQR